MEYGSLDVRRVRYLLPSGVIVMDIVGAPATHQDVISRVTDQTCGIPHIVIFVRVDKCAGGCQAGDGCQCASQI